MDILHYRGFADKNLKLRPWGEKDLKGGQCTHTSSYNVILYYQ